MSLTMSDVAADVSTSNHASVDAVAASEFSVFTPVSPSTMHVVADLPAHDLPSLDLPVVDATLPCQVSASMDLWFAEGGDDVERAKAMCAACPLRMQCLDGALTRREPWGVWGGEVFIDGTVVARKRGRGRPRKVAA